MLFLNPAALVGLVAVLVPTLAYWYAHRRPVVVGWGAMRFLRPSIDARRRLRIEAGLRLGLRMAVITLVVLFLARPAVRGTWVTRAEGRPPRDVTVLIDNSIGMSARHDGVTMSDAAKARADEMLARMWPGDRVAVFVVGARPTPIVGRLTADRELARNALELLPPPSGTPDWPAALRAAPAEEVVVITAGANVLSETTTAAGKEPPRVWVMDVTSAGLTAADLDEWRDRGPATREVRWVVLAAALALLLAERWLARRGHWPTPE